MYFWWCALYPTCLHPGCGVVLVKDVLFPHAQCLYDTNTSHTVLASHVVVTTVHFPSLINGFLVAVDHH